MFARTPGENFERSKQLSEFLAEIPSARLIFQVNHLSKQAQGTNALFRKDNRDDMNAVIVWHNLSSYN